MTDQNSLDDFGLGSTVEPPLVRREVPVLSPHTGKVAGFLGRELRRDDSILVYTTLRGRAHFYRAGGGWAISDQILDHLEDKRVSRILVHDGTGEDDGVYEYPARMYYDDGSAVHERDLDNADDPQTYVEQERYLHHWPDHAAALFVNSFSNACSRIRDKRGWPEAPP